MRIYNNEERQIAEIIEKYSQMKPKRMYRQPTEQLMNRRRDFDSGFIYQTPFTNSFGITQWTDFSLFDKSRFIDIRIEVKSLRPKQSSLRCIAYEHVKESKHIPEKLLVLVLLGEGYNEYVKFGIKNMIEAEKLHVIVIDTMEKFKNYIKQLFN